MRYYSATQFFKRWKKHVNWDKRGPHGSVFKLMIVATPWMNLECILLSERSHLKVCLLFDSMYVIFGKSYNNGDKNKTLIARGWKWGKYQLPKDTHHMHVTIMKLKSFQAQKWITWQGVYFLKYDVYRSRTLMIRPPYSRFRLLSEDRWHHTLSK